MPEFKLLEGGGMCVKQKKIRDFFQYRWVLSGTLKGGMLCGNVAWLFYRDVRGFVLLPVFLVICLWKEKKREKNRKTEREQQLFAEWLGFLKEALAVGYSLESAVGEAQRGMLTSYSETESFLMAVTRMQRKMRLGVTVEEAFAGLADECSCEEAGEFSEVLCIAKRTGGVMQQVISNTERIIREKQEALRHIRAVLRSREYEMCIMKYMPFAMLLYMQLFLPEFLAPLYRNLYGVCVMSAGLAIYGILVMLVERIGTVSV